MAEPTEADKAKVSALHGHLYADSLASVMCEKCRNFSAALAEARDETLRAVLAACGVLGVSPQYLTPEWIAKWHAAKVDDAYEEGERVGAERERRACWDLTDVRLYAGRVTPARIRAAIAARGPMGEP